MSRFVTRRRLLIGAGCLAGFAMVAWLALRPAQSVEVDTVEVEIGSIVKEVGVLSKHDAARGIQPAVRWVFAPKGYDVKLSIPVQHWPPGIEPAVGSKLVVAAQLLEHKPVQQIVIDRGHDQQ